MTNDHWKEKNSKILAALTFDIQYYRRYDNSITYLLFN